MHPLAALILLAALAAASPLPASPSASSATQQLQKPVAVPRLALLFSAEVGAACAGRCSVTATAAFCAAATNSGNAAPTRPPPASADANLEGGWNSLLLPAQQASELEAEVTINCSDPACAAAPQRFVAWRGAACASASTHLPPLAARPLAGLAAANATSHRVYSLGTEGIPVVEVAYSPPPPPLMAGAPQQEAEQAAANASHAEQPTAACLSQPGPAPAALAAAGDHRCGDTGGGLALKLALAAWTLGCAALGTRL